MNAEIRETWPSWARKIKILTNSIDMSYQFYIILTRNVFMPMNQIKFSINMIIFYFFTTLFMFNCKEKVSSPLDINAMAARQSSTIGEYSRLFRVDKSAKLSNGQYIILNVVNIQKFQEFKTNDNKILRNAVVIENVTPVNDAREYINTVGFFNLLDDYANSNSDLDWYVQSGKENTEIILSFKEDISKYKYLVIGGMDKETNNGNFTKIFPIKMLVDR
ncbi:MAG: hypothetical protein ABUK01_10035 [Leptospirales bacterium]